MANNYNDSFKIIYYNGTLVTARGLEFASQAMAFVTDIDRKFDVKDVIHIDRRFTEGEKTGGLFASTSFKI